MERRARIGYTESQRALMWERWRAGDSLQQIARLFDRHHPSIQGILRKTGGIQPPERRQSRLALSLAEREEISRAVVAGQSIRAIAAGIGRVPSTVSREIHRNGGAESYRANQADQAAWDRATRPKTCKLVSVACICPHARRCRGDSHDEIERPLDAPTLLMASPPFATRAGIWSGGIGTNPRRRTPAPEALVVSDQEISAALPPPQHVPAVRRLVRSRRWPKGRGYSPAPCRCQWPFCTQAVAPRPSRRVGAQFGRRVPTLRSRLLRSFVTDDAGARAREVLRHPLAPRGPVQRRLLKGLIDWSGSTAPVGDR